MTKIVKKIACSFIALTTAFSTLIVGTAAETKENDWDANEIDSKVISSDQIKTVKLFVNTQLENEVKYSQYLLGTRIPFYNWDGDSFVEETAAYFYPVYGDGNVVGIYTVVDPLSPDGSGATYGIDFAPGIDAAIKNGLSEFFLVQYDDEVFIYGNGEVDEIYKYTLSLKDDELSADFLETFSYDDPSAPEAVKPIESDVQFYTSRVVQVENCTQADLEENIRESNFDFAYNKDFAKGVSRRNSELINVTNTSRAADTFYYLPVGVYDQEDTNLCWAISAHLIGQYVTDNPEYAELTPYDIADDQKLGYYAGGKIQNAQWGLYNLYEVSSVYENGFYKVDGVKYYIDKNKPLYASFHPTTVGGMGHAYCVNGYYKDGSGSIVVSESSGYVVNNPGDKTGKGGYYRQIMPKANGNFEVYYKGILVWAASFHLR